MARIIADSCCDLSPELIRKFDIDIVPMDVLINDTNYQDGITINPPELFRLVEKTGSMPKTAAPPIATIMEHFSGPGEIVYLCISSKLSASYQNAVIARENLQREDIHIIDSLNLSTGIGHLVVSAAELNQQGLNATEIEEKVNQLVPKVRSSFIIDTLEYLYKGGRCSAMEMVMGSLLKIRPVIEVRSDGTLGVKKKINGSRKKALHSMIDDFAQDLAQVDPKRVFITHTLVDEEEHDAHYIKDELLKIANIEEIIITDAGATIASHCGPDTIGILYLTK